MSDGTADQRPGRKTSGSANAGAMHTVMSVLRGAEGWLQKRNIEAPRRSAELLLGKVLRLGRLELYLEHAGEYAEQMQYVPTSERIPGRAERKRSGRKTWKVRRKLAIPPAISVKAFRH